MTFSFETPSLTPRSAIEGSLNKFSKPGLGFTWDKADAVSGGNCAGEDKSKSVERSGNGRNGILLARGGLFDFVFRSGIVKILLDKSH